MKFPFLENNELILIDYTPGSSGQLLLRLWSELDSKMNYDNSKLLSSNTITPHKASREIEYDILIPKRITNWFLNKCKPDDVYDYVQFFEFLGTHLVAASQRWIRGSTAQKFYDSNDYTIENKRILYGIHSWNHIIPFNEMQKLGYDVRCISIVPDTDQGRDYQYERSQACYPYPEESIRSYLTTFNEKEANEKIDFCTMLVNKDTPAILSWLELMIGPTFRKEKVEFVKMLLNLYYKEIVDNV
jgi:hypothetical protein